MPHRLAADKSGDSVTLSRCGRELQRAGVQDDGAVVSACPCPSRCKRPYKYRCMWHWFPGVSLSTRRERRSWINHQVRQYAQVFLWRGSTRRWRSPTKCSGRSSPYCRAGLRGERRRRDALPVHALRPTPVSGRGGGSSRARCRRESPICCSMRDRQRRGRRQQPRYLPALLRSSTRGAAEPRAPLALGLTLDGRPATTVSTPDTPASTEVSSSALAIEPRP